MSARRIASKLLGFLKQSEDFETKKVLNCLDQSSLSQAISKPQQTVHSSFALPKKAAQVKIEPPNEKPAVQSKQEPILQTPSIYSRLVNKVKKACPELRIKEHFDIKKAGIPDCDVVLLGAKTLPDVYSALVKAIDKQFALTETVVMDQDLIADLLVKHYKLILAPEALRAMKAFTMHVKFNPDLQSGFIGSSPVLFLDPPEVLSQTISKKQVLWQKIKTILA